MLYILFSGLVFYIVIVLDLNSVGTNILLTNALQ